MTAIIKRITHGKSKGQFRFQLLAKNGEPIAQSYPETYHNKRDLLKTLNRYFPMFEVILDSEK